MPTYVIKEYDGNTSSLHLGLVVEFEGNMMQLAKKIIAKGLAPSAPRPVPHRKKKNPMKGKLKPFKNATPASVHVLRTVLNGSASLNDIVAKFPDYDKSSIRQAAGRLKDLHYLRTDMAGKLETTTEGVVALRVFDEEFPGCAEPQPTVQE